MIKIDEIIKILDRLQEVKFAYLFGSYANDTFEDSSDIDIAIYLDEKSNFFDTKLQVHHLLEIALQKDIDLIILNSVKNFYLLQNIFDKNIILKDSVDDKRVLFELDKEHEILDYMTFKRMLDVA